MAIDPLGPNGISNNGAQHARGTHRGHAPAAVGPAATDAAAEAGAQDSLQLSDVAAAAGTDSAVPTGALSADALRVITQRIAAGAYDTPAAADRLAGKLIAGGEV